MAKMFYGHEQKEAVVVEEVKGCMILNEQPNIMVAAIAGGMIAFKYPNQKLALVALHELCKLIDPDFVPVEPDNKPMLLIK